MSDITVALVAYSFFDTEDLGENLFGAPNTRGSENLRFSSNVSLYLGHGTEHDLHTTEN